MEFTEEKKGFQCEECNAFVYNTYKVDHNKRHVRSRAPSPEARIRNQKPIENCKNRYIRSHAPSPE